MSTQVVHSLHVFTAGLGEKSVVEMFRSEFYLKWWWYVITNRLNKIDSESTVDENYLGVNLALGRLGLKAPAVGDSINL